MNLVFSGITGYAGRHKREIQRCASGPGRGGRCMGTVARCYPRGGAGDGASLGSVSLAGRRAIG